MRRFHPLITGTLLLTAVGFFCRILGFFYRIFLSRTIGAEGLGIYQMIFPVYGIFFSLCAGSIQTAISRFIAAEPEHAKRTLVSGFLLSFSMSLSAALMIRHFSGFLAGSVLMEPRCAPLLSVMAFAIPCTSVHACICGYYYGKEKVSVPAAAQLFEQMIRIFTVFLLASIWIEKKIPITVSLAVSAAKDRYLNIKSNPKFIIRHTARYFFFFFMNFMEIKIIQQISPIMPRTNLINFKVPQIFRDSWISCLP